MTIYIDESGLDDIRNSLEASATLLSEQAKVAEGARATLFFGIDGEGEDQLMASGVQLAHLITAASRMCQREANHILTLATVISDSDNKMADKIRGR